MEGVVGSNFYSRKMLEEATLPKNWNAHTIQALIRQPPASGSIYRLLFEELEVFLFPSKRNKEENIVLIVFRFLEEEHLVRSRSADRRLMGVLMQLKEQSDN